MKYKETTFIRDGKTIFHFDFGGGASQEADSPAVAEIIRRTNRCEDERIRDEAQARSDAAKAVAAIKKQIECMPKEKTGGPDAVGQISVPGELQKVESSAAPVDVPDNDGSIVKSDSNHLALAAGTSCDLLEAAHETAMQSGTETGSLKLLSSMYHSRGGKPLLERLKDRRTRRAAKQDMLARQMVDCELVSQLCTTAINMVKMEKLPVCFENDGSFFQNVLKTKLRVDASQRAAILADSRLDGPVPGLNVKNVGQMNVSQVQQVRNETGLEENDDNIMNHIETALPKHKVAVKHKRIR
ncbi:MAG: hypothetical protein WAX69_03275 [Victivallales bacterium]